MAIQDYPVTELYGCQDGYPLNKNLCPPGQGFHNGIDYGCPAGTSIVVNGVEIGVSGATGAVTGPHLHVGRYVNGQSTDPGVGNGFEFKSAVVFDVGEDATNGKYVRVTADGALWNYLHMSDNSKVKAGDVLQGVNMAALDVIRIVASEVEGYDNYTNIHSGKDDKALQDAWGSKPIEEYLRYAFNLKNPKRSDLVAQIDDLKKQLAAAGGGTATVLKPGEYRVN